jgi:hypothetical protein
VSSWSAGQLQVSPQIEPTSPTQTLSHLVLQQYESSAQTFLAQGSHVLVSFVPAVQIAWLQVLPPPPPPQVSPQIEVTSPTQTLSQSVLQQYSSEAQILAAQGSQLAVRSAPVVQIA